MGRFDSALAMLATDKHPGVDEWNDLADAVNTVETLALEMRLVDESVMREFVEPAVAAMVAAAGRHHRGMRMGLSGRELLALREVLDVYAICLQTLKGAQMSKARELTERRLHAVLKGQHVSKVKVVMV